MSDVMNVGDAKAHFSHLIDKAAQGATTIIAKAGTPVAKIVPLNEGPKKVVFGTMKGMWSKELVKAIEAPLAADVLASFYRDDLET